MFSPRQIKLQSDLTLLFKSVCRFREWDLLECVKSTASEAPLLPRLPVSCVSALLWRWGPKKYMCACVCVFYSPDIRCLKAFWTIIYLFMWICMKCHGMFACVRGVCVSVCVCVCASMCVRAGGGRVGEKMEQGAENAASCWGCWLFLLFADKRQLSLLSNPS